MLVLLSHFDDKWLSGARHPLDRKPGSLEVDNKGRSGIGAWLYRRFNQTITYGQAGEKIQTVTHSLTIEVTRGKFGAEFAKLYGTRESRRIKVNEFALGALSLVVGRINPVEGSDALRIVIGNIKRWSEPVSLLAQGFVALKTSYDSFRYEAGCKIEEKVVIKTTTYKDGHIHEKIKRIYSASGDSGSFCDTLENSERIF
jgi:hypothetical protein